MSRSTPDDRPRDLLSHQRMLDRDGKRDQAEYWSARSAVGMIATAHYLATDVGAKMLAQGGNAFDAAVAAAFTLGVCEPAGSGIGGMAIVLAHDADRDRTFTIEGACRAPRAARPETVAQLPDRNHGYQAVAVPTNLAVLNHIICHYCSQSAKRLLAPAIDLADQGVPLTTSQYALLARSDDWLRVGNARESFTDRRGDLLGPGEVLQLPALASTLRRLATHGLEDFYSGGIAREIVADMEANGGFIDEQDLASDDLWSEQAPLEVPLGDDTVRSTGPPAGGLALLQMLNLSSRLATSLDPDTPEGAVLTAAIIRQARRDRRAYRLTTGARDPQAAAELLTNDYADRTAVKIRAEVADVPSQALQTPGSLLSTGETSHISVMDSRGNAVALTQSIERSFGAAVATPTLGFLYNGYLRAFKVENTRHPHYLRPGMLARSNAAPTMVFRDGRPSVCIGSTGSERMASGIFQVLVRLVRQSPFDAVHAPRLHCTPQGQVWLEADRFPAESLDALSRHGFTLFPVEPYAFAMGGLQLVVRRGPMCYGVGEPRRDSAAAGPDEISPT